MSKTALLVIDVQQGMFGEEDPVYQGGRLLEVIASLLEKARSAQAPVIYIQHMGGESSPLRPGTPGFPIHPAIAPCSGEPVIQKRHPDSFQETSLQETLEAGGIRRLVLCGNQSDFCVDTTCRRAYSLGYEVILAADGHSTWNDSALTAEQIIRHHNANLGGWFADVKAAAEIEFR